jgi:hypothetical protein
VVTDWKDQRKAMKLSKAMMVIDGYRDFWRGTELLMLLRRPGKLKWAEAKAKNHH